MQFLLMLVFCGVNKIENLRTSCVDDLIFIFGNIKFPMLMVVAEPGGYICWYKVLKKCHITK